MKVLALQLAAALLCGAAAGAVCSEIAPCHLTIDPSRVIGPVKPVNGVGQPPMVGALSSWSMMHYLKEAGIPYSRLHDVGGRLGGGVFVDIPNLFPDFDADEENPASYRFAFTDSLMKALVENGVEPFFRLGVSIENWVFYGKGLPALRTKPPKDFAKWARICEHVIRHYTEGWADGFQMKVEYWEIWNEPEGASMFGGTWKEFMRLYGTAATHLKSQFPHLKIGGYGSCGFYAGVEAEFVEAANIAPNLKLYLECANKFLAAARDNNWPLDFFSFHSYSAPKDALHQVRYADRLLDQYGFTHDKTERIFDEWLPFPSLESLGTADQAAAIAAELIGLQNGPCDLACIYDARCGTGSYSALFNPLTQKPHKAYWAFVAFNELRKRGTAIEIRECGAGKPALALAAGREMDAPAPVLPQRAANSERAAVLPQGRAQGAANPECAAVLPQGRAQGAALAVYSTAARGADGSIAVMLANIGKKEVPFSLEIAGVASRPVGADLQSAPRCRIVDAARTWEEIPLPAALPPHSILVVEFP